MNNSSLDLHIGADGYIRNKRDPLATIERAGRVVGSSLTVVFVHGLLSGCFPKCRYYLTNRHIDFSLGKEEIKWIGIYGSQ